MEPAGLAGCLHLGDVGERVAGGHVQPQVAPVDRGRQLGPPCGLSEAGKHAAAVAFTA